ncbi:MAG: DNA polymerase/3'-5' exonuclease PolX [Planctomycetota bacterium]|nr:DNA polymerase/3'-5' exonuclease PolX [Planctomycetota bacterium]
MAQDSGGNQPLADLLAQMAQMLELTGADKFRIIAHQRAARAIESRPEDLCSIAREQGPAALTHIEGIGPKIADKIAEFARTGIIEEHQRLRASVPPGLLDVLNVPGLGPKTIRVLWQKGGVQSVDDLRRIIEDQSILKLPRMGKKTVENILAALLFSQQAVERLPLGIAAPIAEGLAERLRRVPGVARAHFAGSLRRGRDTIGDLDILVATSDPAAARAAFTSMPEVTKVLAAGEAKCSVRLQAGDHAVQADLRIVPEESWGAALLYFTGSKEHNVRVRERAQKKNLTLNEYGLYPEDNDPLPPHQRSITPIASASEEDIFKALGLPPVPPELREERDIDAPPPPLVDLSHIRSELHAHTTASDGKLSIVQLAEAARSRGFHTIAITDHSQSSAISGGLKPDELRRHIDAVRHAQSSVQGIRLLAGSEVDILADGSLDYDDDLLALLDIVVASPHSALRQDAAAATARLIRAATHPLVHIIAHPTGRLINKREGLAPDIAEIAAAAAQHATALEINSNWMRLDLRDIHVRAALAAAGPRALIAINCDVHKHADFDHLRFGVLTARRGGLDPARCVNTWEPEKLAQWLRSKR